MASKDFSIDVQVGLVIPDETVDRCLRLLEMWLEDNPQCEIVGERHPLVSGGEHIILKVRRRDS